MSSVSPGGPQRVAAASMRRENSSRMPVMYSASEGLIEGRDMSRHLAFMEISEIDILTNKIVIFLNLKLIIHI